MEPSRHLLSNVSKFPDPWSAPTPGRPASGQVKLPGSKSLSNRELVLSALARTPTRLRNLLVSRDTELMQKALEKLGTGFSREDSDTVVTPPAKIKGGVELDCGLAGTVLRFLPPLASLAKEPVRFFGDPVAAARPMAPTLTALRVLGVEVLGEELPFEIRGRGGIRGGEITLDSSASSQFISGLLLSAARFEHGLKLTHSGSKLPSRPHIEMTLKVLAERGVRVSSRPNSWRVEPGQISGGDIQIESDLSNAAPFLIAPLILGGKITVLDWPEKTTQVGDCLRQILPRFGARLIYADSKLTVSLGGQIRGAKLNLAHAGELVPNLAALAALAATPSEFSGIGHIRRHETDRLKALETEINRLGGRARAEKDRLIIEPRPLSGGLWRTYADHRLVTTGALIALKTKNVLIQDPLCTVKTFPGFIELWKEKFGP